MGLTNAIKRLLEQSPAARAVAAAMLVVIGLLFLHLIQHVLREVRMLERDHGTVTAEVTQYRKYRNSPSIWTNYDLKYQFQLQDGGPIFIRTESPVFGGTEEVWSSLPQCDWEKATQSGKVEVEYYRPDPTISTPVAELNGNSWIIFWGTTVGILITLGGIIWLPFAVRQWWRA
jgi:hypothetical protein